MSENKYTEVELKEANSLIKDKLAEARSLISECEALADKYSLEFDWSVSYGMGGCYYGEGQTNPHNWYASGDDNKLTEGMWYSSSESC